MTGLSDVHENSQRCQACLLTPRGRGAIATVAVFGDDAVARVESRFLAASGRPLATAPPRKILFGRWRHPGESAVGEEVVVVRFDSRRIEVHCHGGEVAAESVLKSLAEEGVVAVDSKNWFARHEPDSLRANALACLGAAATERVAAILLDQSRGALSREYEHIEQLLVNQEIAVARKRLTRLQCRIPLGARLTTPWRVVVAGEPNVGKSSLTNAILGYERSIVFNTPGTTRDRVTAETVIDGWPVEIVDTAGLHDTNEVLEAAGIQLTAESLQQADLILWVTDLSDRHDRPLEHASELAPSLSVGNKSDLCDKHGPNAADQLRVSARTGAGIAELLKAIVKHLVPYPLRPGDPVPFTADAARAIHDSLELLDGGDSNAAATALRRAW